jgi:hypothetical protein
MRVKAATHSFQRAGLTPHVDPNDSILIIGVTADRSGWLPKEAWDWINDQLQKAA